MVQPPIRSSNLEVVKCSTGLRRGPREGGDEQNRAENRGGLSRLPRAAAAAGGELEARRAPASGMDDGALIIVVKNFNEIVKEFVLHNFINQYQLQNTSIKIMSKSNNAISSIDLRKLNIYSLNKKAEKQISNLADVDNDYFVKKTGNKVFNKITLGV